MNKFRIISTFSVFFIVVSLFSCRSTTRSSNLEGAEVPPNSNLGLTDSAIRAKSLSDMARQIATYSSLDAGAVGIAGAESEQYRRFKYLEKFASENELINLTQHKSGIVKGYAFWALCNRNSNACKEILNKHLDDDTEFTEFSGCMQSSNYVNAFYLNLLSQKLSKEEILACRQKIKAVLGSKANFVLSC